MARRYTIADGPSKEDIMVSISAGGVDWAYHHYVKFHCNDSNGNKVEVGVAITGIAREGDSGEEWRFEGLIFFRGWSWKGSKNPLRSFWRDHVEGLFWSDETCGKYSTKSRTGHINL